MIGLKAEQYMKRLNSPAGNRKVLGEQCVCSPAVCTMCEQTCEESPDLILLEML